MSYDILYCALCGKNYNDVNALITRDGTTICDVCYEFCWEQSRNNDTGLSEKNPEKSDSDIK